MSLSTSIMEHLNTIGGSYTSRELADALGEDAKKVSDTLGRLAKTGKLAKQGTKFSALDSEPVAPAAEAPKAPRAKAAPRAKPAPAAEETPVDNEPMPDPATLVPGDKAVDIKDWKRKIAGLLAKAERTDNAHERDAYNKMAEKLMLRLGIHRAELEAVGAVKKEAIVQDSCEFKGNYSLALVPFACYLANGFGGLTTLQSRRSAMSRVVYVVGPKSQVEEFMLLLNSMVLQAFSALKVWQAETVDERRDKTDMERAVMHRSFVRGFGLEVRDRLAKARRAEEKTASPGAALVVASREADVAEWITAQYGEVNKARGGMKYASAWSADAGREAGKKANLGGKAVAGKKSVSA